MASISEQGLDFLVRHEGFVSRAYKCPAGKWTIGTGFTNGSKVAVQLIGKIGPGKTITREQNDKVLREVMAREYGPAVDRALPGAKQHERDAGDSYAFNCGIGAIAKDTWTALWRQGKIAEAAARLKVSRTTGNGVRLAGLERRRTEEARLLLKGDYGVAHTSRSVESPGAPRRPDPVLRDYQEKLRSLGFDPGMVDGWHGPKTSAAVLKFQKGHPHLKDDGILGTATKAQIERQLKARKEAKVGGATAGGAVVIGTASKVVNAPWGDLMSWFQSFPSSTVIVAAGAALVAIVVAVWVIRRRDELVHWFRSRRGR